MEREHANGPRTTALLRVLLAASGAIAAALLAQGVAVVNEFRSDLGRLKDRVAVLEGRAAVGDALARESRGPRP